MVTRVFPLEREGRSMVGLLSMPDTPPRQAWLFLNPFGQEAVRASPMYRSLADRLVRNGNAVLRFDYHGSGDSAGEARHQSLEDWIDDSVHAMRTLQATARAARIRMFGVALGATLAVLAAAKQPAAVESILAWEPIIDGTAYLQALMATHRREIASAFDLSWSEVQTRFGEPEPQVPGRLLGFELGPAMVDALAAFKALPLAALESRGVRTTLARSASSDGIPGSTSTRLVAIETPIDWMTNEALGTALVPQQLIALLEQQTASQ